MTMISVIMPIYNTDEFLEQSILTAVNQTYADLELLLINDNSDDNSKQIMEKFKGIDARIKVFHFNERVGVGATRNFGIDQSLGKYIYFLDSDDYLHNDTLRLLVENINDYEFISGRLRRSHLSEVTTDEGDEEDHDLKPELEVYTHNKYRLIRNNSVLNRLFTASFIKENNFRFSEQVETYSDLAFIVPIISSVEAVPYMGDCLYYKRRRNDPITNPSLMQTSMEGKINDFTAMYTHLKDTYADKEIGTFIDKQLLNFYSRSVVRYFNKNENVDSVFSVLVNTVKGIDKAIVRSRPFMIRREMNVLKRGNIDRFKRVNLWHHRIRRVKTVFKSRRRFYIQLYRALFLKMPIKKDMIVFESFLGKSYSDSPKYIYEYMLEKNLDYTYVWIFNEKKDVPGSPIQAIRFSLKYYYYLARAKYWVSNSRMPLSLNKRDGNIYLQTWHGTPLKTLVFDINDVYSADPAYKRNFYRQSRRWDYLSSPNDYSSNIFRRAFKYEKEMLEFGYPRNDILYKKNTKNDVLDIKTKMNLPKDKKIILYAPTWRDDEFYSRGKYKFTLQLNLEKLQKQLGDEYVVLLRMHYFIASQMDISEYQGFVYDFSHYDDIAELYLISDLLITDYSSVFFDYANLKRPILFFTYDLEKYRDTLRGFYIDMEKEVPGPLLMDTEEIINAVVNIDQVTHDYEHKYEEFYNKYCKWDDGNASERTVKALFKK